MRLDMWQSPQEVVPEEIEQRLEQRQQARAARRWPEADQLRDAIDAAGCVVEDTAAGPRRRRRFAD